MNRGLYSAVSGLATQEAMQNVITNNMANVNTVGFKGDTLAVKKFDDVLIKSCDALIGKSTNSRKGNSTIGKLCYGSRIDETKTNFIQGTIENTDKPTDFAIEGNGFFVVRRNDVLGNNDVYYSRDGHFHVNYRGELVNDSGDNLLDTNGNIIVVGDNEINCDNQGNIRYGNNVRKINVVDFPNGYDCLQKVGDNLYISNGENPIPATNYAIRHRALEKSNINVINEMVNMMTTMRIFETNQRIVQSIDETLGKAVNEVGTVR